MEMLEYLRRQFAYNSWANREVFGAISGHANLSNRPLQLLSHILSAERLWLERIRQQPQSLPVWPDFTFAQCGSQIDDMAILWKEYFARFSPQQLTAQASYKNTKGEPWTSTVQDILTHVLLHSSYHRGQIASEMRSEDVQPAYTDFIHAVRQGLIE
jgi:uncharacterized damage-inducible protein DinB